MSEVTREVAVLFSGGRDSSLSTCLLARDGYKIHLVTVTTGSTIAGEMTDFRVQELQREFADSIVQRVRLACPGLLRRIAFANIEDDFARYRTNLILLGNQMTIQTAGIVYCMQQRISRLAVGFTSYQSDIHYMEQSPTAIALSREFAGRYGIDLVTPVYHYESVDDVKYDLLDFNITTKSLEAQSLFGDTFSPATDESIQAYMKSKFPVCAAYIERKLGGRPTETA